MRCKKCKHKTKDWQLHYTEISKFGSTRDTIKIVKKKKMRKDWHTSILKNCNKSI